MTSLEYVLELCSQASKVLGVPYIKTTPSRLQKWTEKNKPPFIAMIDLAETSTKVRNNIIPTYNLAFVAVVASEKDPSDEKITEYQIEADKLAKEFWYLINSNTLATVDNFDLNELFRDGAYLGVGKGFSMSVSLPNLSDYCDLFCNESMNNIDCEK